MADNIGFDDGMTDDERSYFSTGGDVSDALAKEAGLPLGQEPPAALPDPAPGLQEQQHQRAVQEMEDPGDEIVPGQANPRRVSYRKYQSLEQQLTDERRQRQEDAVKQARIEERLNLLQQAMQPEPAAAPQEPEDERPDPTQDIFAYTAWQERQLTKLMDKVNTYEQQIQTGQAEMEEERRYFNSMDTYARQDSNFLQAYNYLLRSRAVELMGERFPNATDEQLWQAEIPTDIGDMLRQEERSLYKNAFAGQRNPGADIVRFAKARGWRAPQAAPSAPAQPANGAAPAQPQPPGTPLGAVPAAPAAAPRPGNGAATPAPQTVQQSPAAPGQAPTATELVEAIRRGQPAATSLSNGSGSAVNQLTPETLANMSDEDFAAIFNELQHGGNKGRLAELMGR